MQSIFLLKQSTLKEDENIIYKTPSRWWSHYGHQKFPKSLRTDASKVFLGANLTLSVSAAEIESSWSFLCLMGSLAKTEPLVSDFNCGLLCYMLLILSSCHLTIPCKAYISTKRAYLCKGVNFSNVPCFIKHAFYWLPNSENGSLGCL